MDGEGTTVSTRVAYRRGHAARLAEARSLSRPPFENAGSTPRDPEYHEHVAGDKHSHAYNGPHSHGGVEALVGSATPKDSGNKP